MPISSRTPGSRFDRYAAVYSQPISNPSDPLAELGRTGLARIKHDDSLVTIPTVILTTSEAEADILKSYQLHANSYLSKPLQLDAFQSLVKSINDFWLTKAKLPQHRQSG